MKAENYIRSQVCFIVATQNAVRIGFHGEEEWVPRSCLSYRCDQEIENLHRHDDFLIEIAEWKALQIGLI